MRVEILTEEGYRLRGYSKQDAAPLKGDSLRHKVTWKNRGRHELPPGKYMLRVHLDNATLYAVDLY